MRVAFVCPRCHGPLRGLTGAYACDACQATYPIVSGIPDFRVSPDPWLGMIEDRAKAVRVEAATAGLGFEASAQRYWEMTPETPAALASHYVAHVEAALPRSREWLATLPRAEPGTWLELGCGTGDFLAAAGPGASIIGTDIALRWLVIARRRPELQDGRIPLVCCCAEALPFAPGSFSRVVGIGLLEHCADPLPVCAEARRVLVAGGDLVVRTVNRYSVLAEPHVRIWGVGFVPRRHADRYVRWRTGLRYLHHRPLSIGELRRALGLGGFRKVRVQAAAPLAAETVRLGRLTRRAVPWYARGRRVPGLRAVLAWIAPLLEARGEAG